MAKHTLHSPIHCPHIPSYKCSSKGGILWINPKAKDPFPLQMKSIWEVQNLPLYQLSLSWGISALGGWPWQMGFSAFYLCLLIAKTRSWECGVGPDLNNGVKSCHDSEFQNWMVFSCWMQDRTILSPWGHLTSAQNSGQDPTWWKGKLGRVTRFARDRPSVRRTTISFSMRHNDALGYVGRNWCLFVAYGGIYNAWMNNLQFVWAKHMLHGGPVCYNTVG